MLTLTPTLLASADDAPTQLMLVSAAYVGAGAR
jgi:hypothetical protein